MSTVPAPTLPPPVAASPTPARKAIDSRTLLAGSNEIVIHHLGAEYRLRQTRQGKLILTK